MPLSRADFSRKSPLSRRDLNIFCLSDIHINSRTSPALLDSLAQKAKEVSPDYIFITGDLVDYISELPAVEPLTLSFLNSLTSVAKTILIFGNHDVKEKSGEEKYRVPRAFREKLKSVENLVVLDNDSYEDENLFLLSFSPSFSYLESQEKFLSSGNAKIFHRELKTFLSNLPSLPDKPRLFLTHSPVHGDILTDNLKDFDLIISGHMHNGCLPAPLLKLKGNRGLIGPSWTLFPRFARGRFKNLIILPPVMTFASKFRFLQHFYHNFYTVIKIK